MERLCGVTKKLHNENGFTLIELIITIAIIAIAASISGFGVNSIFSANLEGMTHDIGIELQHLRFKTTGEFDTRYQMILSHDATTDKYGYIVERLGPSDVTPKVIETHDYRISLRIYRYNISTSTWVELKNSPGYNPSSAEDRTFTFDASDGSISDLDLDGATLTSLASNATGTVGKYKVVNSLNNEEMEFEVVKRTGRVVVND